MNLREGALLQSGRYRIERVLGQGGFGITYLAKQTSLLRDVAIKEFFMRELCDRNYATSQVSVGSVGSREIVERFRNKFIKEAQNIAQLKHRNIVSVIDIFEENGTAYYVMEYVPGGSLADRVKNGALPEPVAVHYIRQVASALELLHNKNMMHLDIKPGNILVDKDDKAVLIDFGLSKQYDGEGHQTSSTPVGISHGYAPLEQYKRGGVSAFSPAADIYSLGATLYKLVTSITPPEAGDIVNDGLPELPANLSFSVRNAIETAMQPVSKNRPQNIADFLSLLGANGTADSELEPESQTPDILCDDVDNRPEVENGCGTGDGVEAADENTGLMNGVDEETCLNGIAPAEKATSKSGGEAVKEFVAKRRAEELKSRGSKNNTVIVIIVFVIVIIAAILLGVLYIVSESSSDYSYGFRPDELKTEERYIQDSYDYGYEKSYDNTYDNGYSNSYDYGGYDSYEDAYNLYEEIYDSYNSYVNSYGTYGGYY